MIKTKVIKIEDYRYTLETKYKTYEKDIEFIGEKAPEINDIIYINKKILEEINIFAYGPLNSAYSKNKNIDDKELIKIINNNQEYYLQRYYG